MGTDIFKVSGTAPLTNTTGSMSNLRGVISQLVGGHSRQEFEEFKVALKVADIIESNGKVVWNRNEEKDIPDDLEAEWEYSTKQKFEDAKKIFQDFPNSEHALSLQILLQGLNRDTIRYAQSTVTDNYKFKGMPYSFFFEYPPHNPLASLKFKRQNLLFTIEFTSSSRVLNDGKNFFQLTKGGLLKEIKGPTDNSGQTICNMTVIAQLDLTDFLNQTQASFEITISSDVPGFEYCGSSWAPEIVKLENKSLPIASQTRKTIIDSIQQSNVRIGIIMEEIISPNSTFDPSTLLSLILHLFNETMKVVLLKNRKEDLFNAFSEDLKSLTNTTLQENKVVNFLESTKDELVTIFQTLTDEQLNKICQIFYGSFISEVRASAFFISENTKLYLQNSYLVNEDFLHCMVDIIWSAIDIICTSLESIKNIKKEEIEIKIAMGNISKNLNQFLKDAIQAKLPNNPFNESLITNEFSSFIRNYFKNKQTSLKQENLTEFSPTDPLLAAKTKCDIEAGKTIANIISLSNNTHDWEKQFLLPILKLFNQITLGALLKIQLKDNPANNIKIDLNSLIKKTLKEYHSFDLIGIIQDELVSVFLSIENIQFLKYLEVFRNEKASNLSEVALSLIEDHQYKSVFNVLKAFEVIKLSLEAAKKERNIQNFSSPGGIKKTTKRESIPIVFQTYLSSTALENPKNPFLPYLIDVKLLRQIENFSKAASLKQEDQTVAMVIHATIPPHEEKIKLCGDPEKVAALLKSNPLIEGFNDGPAIEFTTRQILKLYPTAEIKAKPYFPIIGIAMGAIGTLVGRQHIIHPNQKSNFLIRAWKASTNGAVIFVFALSGAIEFYLLYHPNNKEVSNKVFWNEIASGPLTLAALHTIWNFVSPNIKQSRIKTGLDFISRASLYSGIFDVTLLNFIRPNNLNYQFITVIPGILASMGHMTRHKEKFHSIMTHLISINFIYLLGRGLFEQLQNHDKNNKTGEIEAGLIYTQIAFWVISLIYWTYFLSKHSLNFIKEYKGEPELTTQVVPKGEVPPNGVTISFKDYKILQEFPIEGSQDLIEGSSSKRELLWKYANEYYENTNISDKQTHAHKKKQEKNNA